MGAGIITRWMHQKKQHYKALHIHLQSQKQFCNQIIETVIKQYEFREEYTQVNWYDASNKFPCELPTGTHGIFYTLLCSWSEFNDLMQKRLTTIPTIIIKPYASWTDLITVKDTLPTKEQIKTMFIVLTYMLISDDSNTQELRDFVYTVAKSQTPLIIPNEDTNLQSVAYYWATNWDPEQERYIGFNSIGKILKVIANLIRNNPLFPLLRFKPYKASIISLF